MCARATGAPARTNRNLCARALPVRTDATCARRGPDAAAPARRSVRRTGRRFRRRVQRSRRHVRRTRRPESRRPPRAERRVQVVNTLRVARTRRRDHVEHVVAIDLRPVFAIRIAEPPKATPVSTSVPGTSAMSWSACSSWRSFRGDRYVRRSSNTCRAVRHSRARVARFSTRRRTRTLQMLPRASSGSTARCVVRAGVYAGPAPLWRLHCSRRLCRLSS
jgi:hypothetical protein